jgi:AcrR family transcriptional regulator
MNNVATTATRRRRPYAARVPMAERREQLLDAALAIIARDGYGHLSIDAIAREAGVTRPVVYGAFERLDALLFALLDREESRTFGGLVDALPDLASSRDLETYLTDSARSLTTMFAANPDQWRPILLTQSGAPAPVIERIEADRVRLRALITQLIDRYSAGNGNADLDAPAVAQAIVALLEHFGRLMLTEPAEFTPERVTAAAAQLVKLAVG